MKQATVAKNHLTDDLYAAPETATMTMTSRLLRETLLETGGTVFACGQRHCVRSKSLGLGVHKVWLELEKK